MTGSTLSMNGSYKRGVILVGVMGMLALLSIIIGELLLQATKEIRYQALFNDREQLRCTAYNTLSLSLAVLNELHILGEGLKSPQAQAWDAEGLETLLEAFPLPEDVTLRLEVWDETGKLPLLASNEVILNALFTQLGLKDEAPMLADSLLDFMESDEVSPHPRPQGGKESVYQKMSPPYLHKQKEIQTFDELRLIQGFEKAFFTLDEVTATRLDTLKKVCSLVHKGPVNVNTSTPLVRAILAQTDEDMGIEPIEMALTGNPFPDLSKDNGVTETTHNTFFKDKGELPETLSVFTRILGLRIHVDHYERHFGLEAYIAVPGKKEKKEKDQPKEKKAKDLDLEKDKKDKEPTEPDKDKDSDKDKEEKEKPLDASEEVSHAKIILLKEI